ncbi:DUF2721 domain-containing protein [Marinibactrum halimedae]|uniref:DUF2721 domain-containing protein n=1 Tax=Marinibactrum halimedae TaxID=1444977 RepID=A0AA37WPB3_9GAMM|nr:DUF2721 domain-containing protein [Marinibactrum halimedae]MCD9459984.1 DUF2721 domain-containing protein [Marinibactrum halimedae]GLS28248.1 DUF2721 domain-containing protein [Marinibactrum halimedae]
MELTLTTPAMLFPAVSLLLLAYTNRFLALSSVIRNLDPSKKEDGVLKQIDNLQHRVRLIRYMQEAGGASFLFCVLSMIALYQDSLQLGSGLFFVSLLLLCLSLWLSIREVHISLQALNVHLEQFGIKHHKRGKKRQKIKPSDSDNSTSD